MKCDRCKMAIPEGENRDYQGEVVCEDCYVIALSPPRFCDPWATYAAQRSIETGTSTSLNPVQEKIIACLKENGEMPILEVVMKFQNQIVPADLERECAALARIGKISVKGKNNTSMLSLKCRS